MRIVHCADIHIGMENYGHPDPATGLSTRLGDFLKGLDAIVDYAIENDIDIVIMAGDAYKSRDPSQTHQREFAKRIERLTQAGVPIFLLVGNHDLPNAASRATAVDIYATLRVPHVHIGANLRTYTVPTNEGPLQIVAVPWPRRAPAQDLSIDEARRELERTMTEAIQREVKNLDPEVPAIITGHVTVYGATVGSERSMMLGNDHVLLTSALAWPEVEYVALGHIHKHQMFITQGDVPFMAYAGSIERVDFSEEDDKKGFMVVEFTETRAHHPSDTRAFAFEVLPARRFVTVDVEVATKNDPTVQTVDEIAKRDPRDIKDAVVRVRVKMPAEAEPHFQESAVRQALAPAHFIAAITREITGTGRQTRLASATVDDLQPMQALRLYLVSTGATPERQDLLIASAEALSLEVGA